MLKKRIIFTLIYSDGYYMLSRNFRLQKVGDLRWLKDNYNFSTLSNSIDELVILDASRLDRDNKAFCSAIKEVVSDCFIPVSAGGGIRDLEQVRLLLRSGADKVVLNSSLIESPELIVQLAKEFGQQCIVASVDVKSDADGKLRPYVNNGSVALGLDLREYLEFLSELPIGELYLNSIDRDGTGQGYDMKLLENVPSTLGIPVIVAGGAGNYKHFIEALDDSRVSAVATAHLFNFVGDGLASSRLKLLESGFNLASWYEWRLEN